MTPEEYIELYDRYMAGKCSIQEEELLFSYHDQFKFISDDMNALTADETRSRDAVRLRLMEQMDAPPKRIVLWRYWLRAAAAVLVLGAGVGLWFSYSHRNSKIHQPLAEVIELKKTSPSLTLANGSVINLNGVAKGVVANDHQAEIKKTADGKLVYNAVVSSNATPVRYNTLDIPRGSGYQLTLPDGSKVWLNAESALTFPTAFTGTERRVTLKGEAYFEVAKNKKMPFVVAAGSSEVQVFGTHFNVSAYAGDAGVTTTLLEGSVGFSSHNGQNVLLKPGQEGSYAQGQITVKEVKAADAVAWINGYFIFRKTPISSIMKQIGRWYDVETVIPAGLKDEKFSGVYARSTDLNELLKGLELTGLVHFKVEGRRITVM